MTIYYFHGYGLKPDNILKDSKGKDIHILDDLEYKLVEYPEDFFEQSIPKMIDYINKIIEEPSYIIGHSIMGLIVYVFSQLHSEKVKGLILIDPLTPTTFLIHKLSVMLTRPDETDYSKKCYENWIDWIESYTFTFKFRNNIPTVVYSVDHSNLLEFHKKQYKGEDIGKMLIDRKNKIAFLKTMRGVNCKSKLKIFYDDHHMLMWKHHTIIKDDLRIIL